MNATKALQELKNKPDYFIKHYPVLTAGHNTAHNAAQANTRIYYLHKKSPDTGGSMASGKTGHYGASRPGKVFSSHTHEISSWVFNTYNPSMGGGDVITTNVLSVPMNLSGAIGFNVAAMDYYVLDGSAELMITGQLSGCCFCWTEVGASLLCAHIKPHGADDGTQLQNLINTNGRFAGMPAMPLGTFGRSDYPGGIRATIIGVRRGGTWNLYAQTSNDLNTTIQQAMKVRPGPVMIL